MPFAVQVIRIKKVSVVIYLRIYILPVQHLKATYETFSNNIW